VGRVQEIEDVATAGPSPLIRQSSRVSISRTRRSELVAARQLSRKQPKAALSPLPIPFPVYPTAYKGSLKYDGRIFHPVFFKVA
jgi:hypothetical protein